MLSKFRKDSKNWHSFGYFKARQQFLAELWISITMSHHVLLSNGKLTNEPQYSQEYDKLEETYLEFHRFFRLVAKSTLVYQAQWIIRSPIISVVPIGKDRKANFNSTLVRLYQKWSYWSQSQDMLLSYTFVSNKTTITNIKIKDGTLKDIVHIRNSVGQPY